MQRLRLCQMSAQESAGCGNNKNASCEAHATVEKRMTPPPRRIGELVLEITMPRELPRDQRARFEEIARGCPVARSLHPDLQLPIAFRYDGE